MLLSGTIRPALTYHKGRVTLVLVEGPDSVCSPPLSIRQNVPAINGPSGSAKRPSRIEANSMQAIGHWMQKGSLLLLPLAIVLELAHAITLGQMLVAMIFFGSLFGIGRIVEGYAT